MPHVSRRKLSKKVETQLITTFKIVLTRLNKQEDVESFLLSLLSETEQIMLAKRLAMVILLREGLSETSIADVICVTRGTVHLMKLFLESHGQGYELAIKEIEKEKNMQEIKKFFVSLARYSIRASGGYVKPTIFD